MQRKDRIERMTLVEREYRAAVVSVSLLGDRLRVDPGFLKVFQLNNRDATRMRANLDSTYLVRLFTEFETGLRDAWDRAFGRTTRPKTEDLLRAIAARRAILHNILDAVDEVRRYRNALVHEPAIDDVPVIAIGEACDRLCLYFSRLPPTW